MNTRRRVKDGNLPLEGLLPEKTKKRTLPKLSKLKLNLDDKIFSVRTSSSEEITPSPRLEPTIRKIERQANLERNKLAKQAGRSVSADRKWKIDPAAQQTLQQSDSVILVNPSESQSENKTHKHFFEPTETFTEKSADVIFAFPHRPTTTTTATLTHTTTSADKLNTAVQQFNTVTTDQLPTTDQLHTTEQLHPTDKSPTGGIQEINAELEGALEGVVEGAVGGVGEGVLEGVVEGAVGGVGEGVAEREGEGVRGGIIGESVNESDDEEEIRDTDSLIEETGEQRFSETFTQLETNWHSINQPTHNQPTGIDFLNKQIAASYNTQQSILTKPSVLQSTHASQPPHILQRPHIFHDSQVSHIEQNNESQSNSLRSRKAQYIEEMDSSIHAPKYSGRQDEDVRDFLQEFEAYISYKKLDGEQTYNLLRIILKDKARDFYTEYAKNSDKRHNVDSFLTEMAEYFQHEQATFLLGTRLMELKQLEGERFEDFVIKVQKMARTANFDQDRVKLFVIAGCRPRIKQAILLAGETTSLKEMERIASLIESTPEENKSSLEQAIRRIEVKVDTMHVSTLAREQNEQLCAVQTSTQSFNTQQNRSVLPTPNTRRVAATTTMESTKKSTVEPHRTKSAVEFPEKPAVEPTNEPTRISRGEKKISKRLSNVRRPLTTPVH